MQYRGDESVDLTSYRTMALEKRWGREVRAADVRRMHAATAFPGRAPARHRAQGAAREAADATSAAAGGG